MPSHSQADVLERLNAARRRGHWIDLPVYMAASPTTSQTTAPSRSRPLVFTSEQYLKANAALSAALQKRFSGKPRVVRDVPAEDSDAFVRIVQDEHLTPAAAPSSGASPQPQCWAPAARHGDGQPLFLHDSTVTNLGLKGDAIPNLLGALLGADSLEVHQRRLHSLLIQPPPHSTACHICATLRCAPAVTSTSCCSSMHEVTCRTFSTKLWPVDPCLHPLWLSFTCACRSRLPQQQI